MSTLDSSGRLTQTRTPSGILTNAQLDRHIQTDREAGLFAVDREERETAAAVRLGVGVHYDNQH